MAQQHNNRNSPHLNHLQQNVSAPSSPSMSSGSQQGSQQRQPVNYPSPTSYPSPSLSSSQYNYPPPGNQNEPYRASPTGSNGSLPLPSMRSLDPLQQQQQQQQQAAQHQHMGSPLPPPVAQMGGPYYQNQLPHPSHQHQYPNVTSDPNLRYALPVENRVMSGGRHKKVCIIVKKDCYYRYYRVIASFEYRIFANVYFFHQEIKRRTKTGCLTCRKRRIKVSSRCFNFVAL